MSGTYVVTREGDEDSVGSLYHAVSSIELFQVPHTAHDALLRVKSVGYAHLLCGRLGELH